MTTSSQTYRTRYGLNWHAAQLAGNSSSRTGISRQAKIEQQHSTGHTLALRVEYSCLGNLHTLSLSLSQNTDILTTDRKKTHPSKSRLVYTTRTDL